MADKKPRRRGTAPNRRADPKPTTDTDGITLLSGHPVLCLRHVQSGWGVGELTDAQCREFLVKWEKRAKLTWKQLVQHPRHGLGSELLPSSKFNPSPPQELARDRYMVFRHEGNHPFAGFRTGDTFHVFVDREDLQRAVRPRNSLIRSLASHQASHRAQQRFDRS